MGMSGYSSLASPAGDSPYNGVYHSTYDSFYWQQHFGDGINNFAYHVSLAQLWGSLALRLSNDLILPVHIYPFAIILSDMYASIHNLTLTKFPALNNTLLYFNNTISKLADNGMLFDHTINQMRGMLLTNTSSINSNTLHMVNNLLASIERYLLYLPGIPEREWYRNLIWCTSIADGYSGAGLALISDNVNAGDFTATRQSLWWIIQAVDSLVQAIQRAQLQIKLYHH